MQKKIFILLLVVFAAWLLPSFLVPYIITTKIVDHRVVFPQLENPDDYGLQPAHFFVTTTDGIAISCYEITCDEPKAVVICISGLHSPSTTSFYGHASLFKENGFASVLFDMRAHGESEGQKIYLGYKEYLDTDAVVAYVKRKYPDIPIAVMGFSLGGAVAINSMATNQDIDALITLSAFSSWEDNFKYQMRKQAPAFLCQTADGFIDLISWCKFGYKESQRKPVHQISYLGHRPALLMHSKEDSEVNIANLEQLVAHAPHPVQVYLAEGDNHFVASDFYHPQRDSAYAGTLLKFLRLLSDTKTIPYVFSPAPSAVFCCRKRPAWLTALPNRSYYK